MSVMDALGDKAKNLKKSYNQPSGDAAAINEKAKNIKEANDYMQSTGELPGGKKPSSAPTASSKPSPKDLVNPKGKFGDKPGENRNAITDPNTMRPLGSFKKGGKVKKTGMYQLHKGEAVLNAQDTKAMESRANNALGGGAAPSTSGPAPDEMNIQKLDDGSFHITHRNTKQKEPMQPDKKFSARNAKHLVRHVRATFGGNTTNLDNDGDDS